MKKAIKITAVILLFLTCGFFIFRCCMVSDKSVLKDLYITDGLRHAYADGESIIYTVNIAQEISSDGYFSAYAFYYNPESSEAQITIRYNDSVFNYLDSDEVYEFDFLIRNTTTGEEFSARTVESAEKYMYNFRKLIIEGFTYNEGDELFIVMKHRGGTESTHLIKAAEQPSTEYKVSGKLLSSLTAAR